MAQSPTILQVALPVPVARAFDYSLTDDGEAPAPCPGIRVRVPFGKRQLVGIVIEVSTSTELDPARIKPVLEVLDTAPVVPPEGLELLTWAAAYYHHPIGDVITCALPSLLRHGKPLQVRSVRRWRLTPIGRQLDPATLGRAPRQAEALQALRAEPQGLAAARLPLANPAPILKALQQKGWVETVEGGCLPDPELERDTPPPLNPAQRRAVEAVGVGSGFRVYLLEGVTGSGKTEVYLGGIAKALALGLQSLVLVPEIGLTPQVVERFRRRFGVPVAVLHSGLNPSERLCAWQAAAAGEAPIVIGTRSAVFVPLAAPGLFIVDEEHDASYKQHDGFRYSARDLAVMRARQAGAPVLLGSATPALESLHNAANGRYQRLELPERAGNAVHPATHIVDLRSLHLRDGLSPTLLQAIGERLERGEQTLLFLNRRGYSPTMQCDSCGWLAECRHCDARLTLYLERGQLRCHHCGALQRAPTVCPDCGGGELRPIGLGTQRVEPALREYFPDAGIARVDRDSMTRKGAMAAMLEAVHKGEIQILLGTQMLAKGHDFPNVTLVGILDVDQGLYGLDFRAPERMAQLIVQVAGRAGRAEKPGEVLIQTHHPKHPLLRLLLEKGYPAFAEAALVERKAASMPPFSNLALLRAEAPDQEPPRRFLVQARALAEEQAVAQVSISGPVPAPMERRAGRYRAQLLIQAPRRPDLQTLLRAWVPSLPRLRGAGQVRWSLDVDPLDMF